MSEVPSGAPVVKGPRWKGWLLAGVLLVLGGCGLDRWVLGVSSATAGPRSTRYADLRSIPLRPAENAALDLDQGTVTATGAGTARLTLAEDYEADPVYRVCLRLQVLGPFNSREFELLYIPASAGGGSVRRVPRARALATRTGDTIGLIWELPEQARQIGFDLPEKTKFHVLELELVKGVCPSAWRFLARLFWMAVFWTLALAALQKAWRPFLVSTRQVKGVLLALTACSAVLLIFLLPPFQGPDEDAHWKTALCLARTQPNAETPLYNLPQILDAQRLQHHPEEKMDAARFHADAAGWSGVEAVNPIQYAKPWSYPFVQVVSLFFPRVESLHGALVFYYLCRALPLLAALLLLAYAQRRYGLPFIGIFFFSLPLVQQQFLVVSTDTLLNVGALGAGLLYLSLVEQFSGRRLAALWALALAITWAKPLGAALCLLPLLHTPLRLLPNPKVTVPACVALALAVSAAALARALGVLRLGGLYGVEGFDEQSRFLCSWEGLGTFLSSYGRFLRGLHQVRNWAQPLGWVDTFLNENHLKLLLASAWVALGLDLFHAPARLRELWRTRRRELLGFTGAALLNLLFISLAAGLVLYLAWTPARAAGIDGLQIRYVFPAAILLVLVPCLPRKHTEEATTSCAALSIGRVAWYSLLLVLPCMLLAARHVELATDLLVRYW